MFKKILSVWILLVCLSFIIGKGSFLFGQALTDTPTPTPTGSGVTPTPDTSAQQKELQDKIKLYEQKVNDLQGQGRTLSSQIKIMDSQILLTGFKIEEAKKKIEKLGSDIEIAKSKISGIEENMNVSTKALVQRITATYEAGRTDSWQLLLSSDTIANFFTKLKYLRIIQLYEKKNIYAAEQAKVNYSNQKTYLENAQTEEEALQKKFVGYTNQLAQEKTAKQQLFDVTKNDEARYQKLLSEARAQISAFKSFASSAGGAQILPPQASPDGWYYNQRDERWGRNLIGSSPEQMWAVGCLVTVTTMVLKKHGENITPVDVASNSSNFFSDTAYMLLPWIGGKFTSIWGSDITLIDGKLSSGEPVIVGLRAGAYGMHFVVLKSGSNGSYTMNDPWYGPDLKFSDHYSTGQIFQWGYYKG